MIQKTKEGCVPAQAHTILPFYVEQSVLTSHFIVARFTTLEAKVTSAEKEGLTDPKTPIYDLRAYKLTDEKLETPIYRFMVVLSRPPVKNGSKKHSLKNQQSPLRLIVDNTRIPDQNP